MRGKRDADWDEWVGRWKREQTELSARRVTCAPGPVPRFVAGADAAFSAGDDARVYAAAVVYDRVDRRVVEVALAVRRADVPYVPGFLSFREGPALLEAIGRLAHPWGAICFDGQGYAHPRRCGLATHLSVTLDVVGVGVAKSRFIGEHDEPGPRAGDWARLTDRDETIGVVLRTRNNTRPLYVSVGHRVDLAGARRLVMACCNGFRIPEPTRQADIEVAKLKRLNS